MIFRTLAIDPGTDKVGITDIKLIENKVEIISTLQYKMEGNTKEIRLWHLYNTLDIYLTKYPEINDISTEATFVVPYTAKKKVSISSPLGLSMARGVIYAVAGKHNKNVTEYDNTTHKKQLTGDGSAKKTQIIRAVQMRLNKKVGEDEAMSVSIGYCHIIEMYQRYLDSQNAKS